MNKTSIQIEANNNLKNLIEIIPAIPVYVCIPIKNFIAPCNIVITYFSQDDTIIPAHFVNLNVYCSNTE